MNLYLVHCGFYDADICEGLYEGHVNYFIAAENFDEARAKVKKLPEFQKKRMHVDGLQEIKTVDGYRLKLEFDATLKNETQVLSMKHRDLAPKPAATAEVTALS